MTRLTLSLAIVLISGCGDPLVPPWLIDGPRVLGARVEAAGDPQRSSPRPGESATVKWIVASPDGPAAMGWALAACLPDSQGDCGTSLGEVAGNDAPTLAFTVPPAETLGPATRVLVTGIFCPDGHPAATGTPGCDGNGAPTLTTLSVPLDRGGEGNLSPSLASATFTIDGAPWPVTDDCAALPVITADEKKRSIGFAIAGQREIYQSTASPDGVARPVREGIQLSHFATAGKLPRQLSFIESSDERDPAELSVDWTAPPVAEVPPGGLVVHFYFVARDLRGGLDWQTRTLCITQP
jgi:hypothetical protein